MYSNESIKSLEFTMHKNLHNNKLRNPCPPRVQHEVVYGNYLWKCLVGAFQLIWCPNQNYWFPSRLWIFDSWIYYISDSVWNPIIMIQGSLVETTWEKKEISNHACMKVCDSLHSIQTFLKMTKGVRMRMQIASAEKKVSLCLSKRFPWNK